MTERPVSENPLYNANKMKIGIIAMNCSHGSTITTAENAWDMSIPVIGDPHHEIREDLKQLVPGPWKERDGIDNVSGQRERLGLGLWLEQFHDFPGQASKIQDTGLEVHPAGFDPG